MALLPGTLLQRSMVTDADPIPAGMVQVGVAVKGGQLPADGLVPGDRVQVLRLPGQVAGAGIPAEPAVLVEGATVFAAHPDPVQPGTTLLTLLVPAERGAGGGGGQRRRCGGGGEGAGVVIVSVCSDKGSPGVSTLATVLGLVWPGQRVVVEADTAGGDLSVPAPPRGDRRGAGWPVWRRTRRSRRWPRRPGWG